MKKKYMLVALAFGLSLSAKVMAQVKIGKIAKAENIIAKDDYGNAKDKFVKIKFTLDNGQTLFSEHQNPIGPDEGNDPWTYRGTNKSKNMYIWTVECPRCALYEVEIRAYEFVYNSKSKKYTAQRIEFHSEKKIDGVSSGPMFDSGWDKPNGWSFNRLENDRIIMTKDGVEYVLKTANKTNGKRYLTFE
ncbi:MAG: hypothetical protein ACOVQG_03100 [Crocinitomicaceae bacterium]|jgi:hypothetical protein